MYETDPVSISNEHRPRVRYGIARDKDRRSGTTTVVRRTAVPEGQLQTDWLAQSMQIESNDNGYG